MQYAGVFLISYIKGSSFVGSILLTQEETTDFAASLIHGYSERVNSTYASLSRDMALAPNLCLHLSHPKDHISYLQVDVYVLLSY